MQTLIEQIYLKVGVRRTMAKDDELKVKNTNTPARKGSVKKTFLQIKQKKKKQLSRLQKRLQKKIL